MQGGNVEVCAGTPVNLSVTSTSTFPIQYRWTLNGAAVGGNQNNIALTAPDAGGNQNVSVQLTDVSGSPRSAQPLTRNITVRVRPYVRPSVKANVVGASEIRRGETATVNAVGAGDCGGALTYTWAASEGNVTAMGQSATFDSKNVAFGPATDRDELKQVTVTATLRDARGATASSPVAITVRRLADFVRLPDVLFNARSSTVNNCGKRILLEEVYPRMRTGNYTIVLVGHVDESERTVANLDRDRAYNAARVLVAGADTQVRVEPARVRADWVGTTQTAAKLPGYCGTSTRPSVAEVRGAAIREADTAAENRRVEVWLVPAGVGMPASVVNARELPANIRPR
jgi:outer membrane protein OmpA-like peptidoglycan-associated protein